MDFLARMDMEPERVYYSRADGMYFWSVDGIAPFWYETREELDAEHGTKGATIHFVDGLLDY